MTDTPDFMPIAQGEYVIGVLPGMANRHGLIAGATGTGKTVTLRVLAEHFSRLGVPVFMADIKGDLSGLCLPGGDHAKVTERVKTLGLSHFKYRGYPVVFWDVEGLQGHPVRTTISEMGPLLLARLLNLNDTQGGVLNLIFEIADDNGLLLLDLKDLRAMARYVGENADQFRTQYGNIATTSIGAIQRNLLGLENQGADRLFGEPSLNLDDFLQTSANGEGVINILAAEKLMNAPKLYATLLLWLLAELFENLPEVGDPSKPTCIFFFDEAHLLFDDAPKVLLEKIEQVVRLVRSKGVGVYFVTQNPLDLPDTVLGQLGNWVQHALRAFTPRDQKAVKAAAETFRTNPGLDVVSAITELKVGEALVSVLDEKGAPTRVERAWILPPHSRLTPLAPAEREQVIRASLVFGHYERVMDRESAYEILKAKAESLKAQEDDQAAQKGQSKTPLGQAGGLFGALAKSAAHAIGAQIGRQIMRGVLGSIFGSRKAK